MHFAQVAFPELSLSALQSKDGVKTSNCSYRGGRCEFSLTNDEWLRAPFGASAYKDPDATRLNFELDVTNSAILPRLQELDQWAIEHVIQSGIFEGMTPEQIRQDYSPCLKACEKYNTIRLRTKLNTKGFGSVKCFKMPDRALVPYNDIDLRNSQLKPVIWLKGIWKQSKQWGLSLETVKLLAEEASSTWDFD